MNQLTFFQAGMCCEYHVNIRNKSYCNNVYKNATYAHQDFCPNYSQKVNISRENHELI